MATEKKQDSVTALKERIDQASAIILTEYRGLKAQDMNRLRRTLSQQGMEYKVVKNTLLRLAAKGTFAEPVTKELSGPIGVLFGSGEAVEAAKAATDRAKEFEALNVKFGVLDRQFCTVNDIQTIAKLPGRHQMLCSLVATVQSPVTNVVFTLQNVVQRFVGTLQAYADKQTAQ